MALSFALVSPVAGDPPHYRLYADGVDGAELRKVAESLETILGESHGYGYARALGQLGPLEAVPVRRN